MNFRCHMKLGIWKKLYQIIERVYCRPVQYCTVSTRSIVSLVWYDIRGGDPKIPGIVKKNYLKHLYKFVTLVPFEVLPLRLDAAIPAPLPVLETLSKIYSTHNGDDAPQNCLKSSTEMLSRAASESLAALDSISVGSGAGIAASSRRGSTSKGTKVSNLYKYFK